MLLLLLLSAWSLRYWQAWLYVGVFGASVSATTWYLQTHDRELLRRRLAAGPRAEKELRQKLIQQVASLAFATMFIVSGLDRHFRSSLVSTRLVLLGNVFVVAGLGVIFLTFRENSYASAIIDTASGQPVISTGPYAVVRHPMYAGALILLLGTPVALGSLWGLVPFLFLLATIVWRLLDEERLLARDLPGYQEYRLRVRYRLVPFLW